MTLDVPVQGQLVVEAAGRLCCRAQHLHPPVKGELALSTEEVDVVLELQLEDVVLRDLVRGARGVYAVTKEGQACQREVILEGFVEVEAEVSEDDPQLLPPVRVLKLPDGDDDDNDDHIEQYISA